MTRAASTSTVFASLDTAHYRFEVIASDRLSALESLRQAWGWHQAQTGAEMPFDEIAEDVQYRDMVTGTVYRDGTAIQSPWGQP